MSNPIITAHIYGKQCVYIVFLAKVNNIIVYETSTHLINSGVAQQTTQKQRNDEQ